MADKLDHLLSMLAVAPTSVDVMIQEDEIRRLFSGLQRRIKELETPSDQELILMMAQRAFPKFNRETARIYSVPRNISAYKMPDELEYAEEVVSLETWALSASFGYGEKTNSLVVRGMNFEPLHIDKLSKT